MRVTPLRSWARGSAGPQIVNISAFHRRRQTASGRGKSGELNTLWTDTERERGRESPSWAWLSGEKEAHEEISRED